MTQSDLLALKQLQKVCEEFEPIKLKLNWMMLADASVSGKSRYHYENGELAGFLGVYEFGDEVELCGMVRPELRRRGIFTNLFSQAVADCRDYRRIILNAPANSESARGFLQSIPCTYEFSEYQMKWSGTELADSDVVLRRATDSDLAFRVKVDVLCFGSSEENAAKFIKQLDSDPTQHCYIIEDQGTPVGKIRVSANDGESWIYGFAILPDCQGRGIGRKALTKIVRQERLRGNEVFLEVEANNARAYRLYESCGFQTFAVQDYYLYHGVREERLISERRCGGQPGR